MGIDASTESSTFFFLGINTPPIKTKIKAVERAHILRQQIHPLMCLRSRGRECFLL
nr:MAG TPA: hypothetical protein [Caudoviricetes sp.]